jgi:hypothetical protein
MISFLDVIDLWESPQVLADDLGSKLTRVQKWRARRRIPPKAWPEVLDAAKRRGLPISADTLMTATARGRKQRVGA